MERPEHEGVSPQSAAPSRTLYVVARNRLDLYAALLEAFVESPRLGIVLDRRDVGARAPGRTERRHLALEQALTTRGWARVRIDAAGQATLADDGDGLPRKDVHGRRADRR